MIMFKMLIFKGISFSYLDLFSQVGLLYFPN